MMYKNNLAAKILLAVMAASVVGTSSVYAAEGDIVNYDKSADYGSEKMTPDAFKVTNGAIVTFKGDKTNDWNIEWTQANQQLMGEAPDPNYNNIVRPKQGNIILLSGNSKLEISDLNTLNFITSQTSWDPVKNQIRNVDGVIKTNVDSNSEVHIHDIGDVNFGSESNRLKADQALHAFTGKIIIDNVNNFNAYAGSGTLMAQKNGLVDIKANNNIVINGTGSGISVGTFYNNTDAKVSVVAENKVKISSTSKKMAAVTVYDNYSDKTLNGNGSVYIEGKNGVDINGDNGIYNLRSTSSVGSSDITIKSNEEVNINANNGAAIINRDGQAKATSKITVDAKTINLESNNIDDDTKVLYTIDVQKADLNLNANNIKVSAANGKAVTLDKSSNLNLGDGQKDTTVTIDGVVNVGENSKLALNDKATLVVASKYVTNADTKFITTGKDSSKVELKGNAKVIVDGAKTGDKLNFSDSEELDKNIINKIFTDNKLQDVVLQDNDLIVTTVSKDEAAKMLAGSVITDVLLQATKDNNTEITDLFTDAGKSNAEQISAINSAANIGELGGTSHGTYSMSNIMTDAVADHLSLATHGEQDKDVWAHYIHNKENVSGLALGGVDGNYDAQYNGIVVGSDLYKNGKATVGVALSYAEGNIDGSTLAARTSNDAEYYGASVYGRIDNGDSAVLGDISYLHSKNDIEQTNSGKTITATPKADAFSVGVKAEQVFNAGAAKFVPYAGLRYMHLGVGNYTDSLGLSYNSDEQNLWLLPVGVTYSQDIKAGSWTLRPVVEAGYVWTMGDRDTQQTVSLNGASDGFGFDVADSGSFISRFALEAENANVTYGLGYEYQKGDTVKANKWMANVNFSF